MKEKIEELQKDFQYLTKDIDLTSYNPMSSEFQKALNIGIMWHVLHEMQKDHSEMMSDEFASAKDELMGAESYYGLYADEHDPTLKSMAMQRCTHANYWINRIRLMTKNNEQQNRYERLKSWYNDLVNKINS